MKDKFLIKTLETSLKKKFEIVTVEKNKVIDSSLECYKIIFKYKDLELEVVSDTFEFNENFFTPRMLENLSNNISKTIRWHELRSQIKSLR